MLLLIAWLFCSFTDYVYSTSHHWEEYGDVLGFRRHDMLESIAFSLIGPFSLLSSIVVCQKIPKTYFLFRPVPPRNKAFLRFWEG